MTTLSSEIKMKQKHREKIKKQTEAFLASGKQIEKIKGFEVNDLKKDKDFLARIYSPLRN